MIDSGLVSIYPLWHPFDNGRNLKTEVQNKITLLNDNLVGNDVENGEIPVSEIDRINQMIEDISYYNAKKFFNF